MDKCDKCGKKSKDLYPHFDSEGFENWLCPVCLGEALEEEE
jgi:hypothetical protein